MSLLSCLVTHANKIPRVYSGMYIQVDLLKN